MHIDLIRQLDRSAFHEIVPGDAGSVQLKLDGYTIDYHPRATDKLVVAFDPRMKSYPPSEGRVGWAFDFLARQNVSAIHVKPDSSCWYRQPQLETAFRAVADTGLFADYDTVMTYGGSMGGFGALSFAGLTGANRVLSINPQINLGPSVRSWETRYRFAMLYDWDGELCDIDRQIENAETVAICYDPYHEVDRKQVDLVSAPHVLHLRVPFVGHRMPGHLRFMRLLMPLFTQTLSGTIDKTTFQKRASRRRTLLRYKEMLLHKSAHRPVRHAQLLRLLPPDGELRGNPSARVNDDED